MKALVSFTARMPVGDQLGFMKHSNTRHGHSLGCFRLGNPGLDLKIWVFGFPMEHKI